MPEEQDPKSALRTEMSGLLAQMSESERHTLSLRTSERVVQAEFFLSALTVMLYLPMPTELDVTPIALRAFQLGKTVCVPRMDWAHKRMTAIEVRGFDDSFEVRRHGVREPVDGRPVAPGEIDLIIVPGVAFDTRGERLGRGSGFYDRYLSHSDLRAATIRCGVCYDFQIVDAVPAEMHDVRVNVIVSDRRTVRLAAPRPAGDRPA